MKRSIVVLVSMLCFVVNYANPAFSGDPVEIPGSTWTTGGVGKTKIKGLGSAKFGSIGDIFFGPQTVADVELLPEEFLLVLDDGATQLPISGTYTVKGKGKPVLVPDITAAEERFSEIGGANVVIQKLKVKAKPKSKGGEETIKINAKIKLLSDGTKVVLSYKGDGVRLEGAGEQGKGQLMP